MSPFTRRVAVSLKIQGVEFEHLDLSTATDGDEVRKYNPMVRVPTVVLDDNTTLIDSDAILDWFDEKAGPKDRLIPESGVLGAMFFNSYHGQLPQETRLLSLFTNVLAAQRIWCISPR